MIIASSLLRALRRWQFGNQREEVKKAWADVEGLLTRGDTMSLRLAVIHADAVLDLALKSKHFPGDTMGHRLRVATYKYRNLRRVGWAHGLRNKLVHEANQSLKSSEAQRAVAAFRSALKEMGAL